MKAVSDAALDECLTMLRDGSDVAAGLKQYPGLAGELRPLLELAAGLRRVNLPLPSAEARAAGRVRMLAALDQQHFHTQAAFRRRATAPPRRAQAWPTLRPVWQTAAALLLAVLVLVGGATVAAAANSLPGDSLYPLKLASQQVQLALTLNPARHELLRQQIQEQRLEDVRTVLPEAHGVHVEFEGKLEEMQDGIWLVGGLPAAVQETTAISGRPYPGAVVRVRGYLPGNGQIAVTELSVEPEESPEVEPGQSEKPAQATKPATATQPAEPTEVLEVRETAEASDGAEPTEAIEATEHPEPTGTAEPTEHPEGPHSEPTVKPGRTPHQTETAEPGHMPHPTETMEPAQTAEPAETGEATELPQYPASAPETTPTREQGDE